MKILIQHLKFSVESDEIPMGERNNIKGLIEEALAGKLTFLCIKVKGQVTYVPSSFLMESMITIVKG